MIKSGSANFWRVNLAFLIGSFIIFANVYVLQPLLPMIAQHYAISALEANTSFTITTLVLGISLLLFGPLSDAWGRKWLMLITLFGMILTTLALSFCQTFDALILFRGLQGFFLAGLPAIAISYLAEELEADAMMMAVGFYIAANSLGGIAGRLLGGMLGEWWGIQSTFFIMTLISTLGLFSFAFLLPNSQHFQAKTFNFKVVCLNFQSHLSQPNLLKAYFIGGLSFFIFINQFSYMTFVLEASPFALSSKFIGMLFLTYLAGTFASSASGKLSLIYSPTRCMKLGICCLILGSLITLNMTLWAILLGLSINSFGFFLTHSTTSAWVSKQAKYAKASASALYLTFYYMGASLGGFYLSPFWQAFAWSGVIYASIFVLLIVLYLASCLSNTNPIERHAL